MHPDRDFAETQELAHNAQALIEDLGLEAVFEAMAGGDALIRDSVRKGVLSSTRGDIATIFHRQGVFNDCLLNKGAVLELFECAGEGLRDVRKLGSLSIFMRSPGSILR